jgi:peptide deformylase
MVLEIVKYGDPVLRAKGKPVDPADSRIAQLAEDMIATMYAANGLGLAAQQVGLPLQMTVIDVAGVQQDRPSTMSVDGTIVDLSEWMPLVLLNPRLELAAERVSGSEGCLSFPEIHGDVLRADGIKVSAQRLDGSDLVFQATGMLARALQHEVDHLHGVLFIDRMNSASKVSLAGRLKRLQKEGAANPTNGQPRPAKPSKKLEPSGSGL